MKTETTHNEFTKLTIDLRKDMKEKFISVNIHKNPFAKELENVTAYQLAQLVNQYNHFPAVIVEFLIKSRKNAKKHQWTEVVDELTRNIGEELGTQSQGKTHYQILLDGLKNGLAADFDNSFPSTYTTGFVNGILKIMDHQSPSYTTGAAYALEASAVPELVIVQAAIKKLFLLHNGEEMNDQNLISFFENHLGVWEPGHEDELNKAANHYVKSEEQLEQFKQGFLAVMTTMDTWWNGMASELLH